MEWVGWGEAGLFLPADLLSGSWRLCTLSIFGEEVPWGTQRKIGVAGGGEEGSTAGKLACTSLCFGRLSHLFPLGLPFCPRILLVGD